MHKIFIRSFVSSLVLLFTFTVAAIAKDVKAAFVYIGPTGDHGWTYQHDVGRKAVEAAGFKTTYVEGVPESADAERVLRQLANSCLLYTSPSPRDRQKSRMPSSA